MSFLGDTLQKQTTVTLREKAAKTYSISLNSNCDFFFRAGAICGRNIFKKFYIEDK